MPTTTGTTTPLAVEIHLSILTLRTSTKWGNLAEIALHIPKLAKQNRAKKKNHVLLGGHIKAYAYDTQTILVIPPRVQSLQHKRQFLSCLSSKRDRHPATALRSWPPSAHVWFGGATKLGPRKRGAAPPPRLHARARRANTPGLVLANKQAAYLLHLDSPPPPPPAARRLPPSTPRIQLVQGGRSSPYYNFCPLSKAMYVTLPSHKPDSVHDPHPPIFL